MNNQTLAPDEIILVAERPDEITTDLPVTTIANKRTPNLSGAINSATCHLLQNPCLDIENTTIAILDDDDVWEPDYLEKMIRGRKNREFSWAGICRINELNAPLDKLPIPEQVRAEDFLVTNPGVQGSNLVIKLSAFLESGGFDEALDATTDRDFMVRLLDTGAKGLAVQEYLVTCDATTENRLSEPKSPRKIVSLQRFFEKYRHRMNSRQVDHFWERASRVFGVKPNVQISAKPTPEKVPSNATDRPMWIGYSTDNHVEAKRLAQSVQKLKPAGLVCVAFGSQAKQVELATTKIWPNAIVLTPSVVGGKARVGAYGKSFQHPDTQSGIGFGRQVLQTELVAHSPSNAWFWVLDDDCDPEAQYWGEPPSPCSKNSVRNIVSWMDANGIEIGIGGLAGGAPLPGLATLRTSLLDKVAQLEPHDWRTKILAERERHSEYYYDLSSKHTSHLETPLPLPPGCSSRWVFQKHSWGNHSTIPVRGGNTLVTNRDSLEALACYDALMPSRRADTIAASRARAKSTCVHIPFHVGHRGAPISAPSMIADIQGAAQMRLDAGYDEVEIHDFRIEREARLKENAWRIRGLLKAAARNDIEIQNAQLIESVVDDICMGSSKGTNTNTETQQMVVVA